MPDVRYRCTNSECSRAEEFLAAGEVVRIEAFGGALYHAYDQQGTLLDPVDGRPNVVRIGSPEAETFPAPCGPVSEIIGPCRIRLRRTKGWRKPDGCINCARPTKWGNPFKVGESYARNDPRFWILGELMPVGAFAGLTSVTPLRAQDVVDAHLNWFLEQVGLMMSAAGDLGGHDLACYCRLEDPCHVDTLLVIANP